MDQRGLLQRVEALIEEVQGVKLVVPEDTGMFTVDDDIVRRARELIARTVDLAGDATDFYDAESIAHGEAGGGEVTEDDFLKEIGAQISSELAARQVSGLAFVARGQLMEIEQALQGALDKRQTWAVASHADSGLRRARKALIALESAIREYEGLPALDHRWVDLADSLQIRRLYGQFRRAILAGDSGSEDIAARLHHAESRIAILRDLKIYPFLRIDDRLMIRQLQKRIAAWLAEDGDDESGTRLWQDLVSFARLLGLVNDREELREHDRRVVVAMRRLLFDPEQPARRITAGHLADLQRLLGRDDDLDHIILHPAEHGVEDLREPLERLQVALQKPFEGATRGFLSPS